MCLFITLEQSNRMYCHRIFHSSAFNHFHLFHLPDIVTLAAYSVGPSTRLYSRTSEHVVRCVVNDRVNET